ncbi:MAG: DUF5777 family beta-barrel protein [Bacteroidales bacterium]
MKKLILGMLILFFGLPAANAQEEEDKPVRSPFASGILIDNFTSVIPVKNTFEWRIQHRFGTMDNGISDIYGIYAPGANIRLGFNYSLRDNLVVGYGLTMKNMYNDFHVKWNVLEQTRQNTIPVAVTLYGNMAIDGRNDEVFGQNYAFTNRFSYFSQLIVGRKFTWWLSLQATASFTHYNAVAADMNHDVIGAGFNGRVNFSPQSSFLFQFDSPLKIESISEQREFEVAEPNFGIGYEVSTSTHAFHIFITSSNSILPQDIYMYNNFEWTNGFSDLMLGFTITRLWNF